jgi:alpha-ribazole phosphatase
MPSTSTTRWWWVRHAPIAPPYDGGFAPLEAEAELGDRAPIEALARRLPADAVWIESPARRTAMTGAALRAALGKEDAPVLDEPAFVEQDFGDWHGQSYKQVYKGLSEEEMAAPALLKPPGGEAFAEVIPRVGDAIARLGEAQAGRDIVAVVHAGTIRAALAVAMDLTPRQAISFVVDLLSVTRLDRHERAGRPAAWSVVTVNSEVR